MAGEGVRERNSPSPRPFKRPALACNRAVAACAPAAPDGQDPNGDGNQASWNDWMTSDWKSGGWTKSWWDDEAERDKYTVVVKGLAYDVEEATLESDFGQCGEIEKVTLHRDWDGNSKGMAFIAFKSDEGVDAALGYDGRRCYGRTLEVKKVWGNTAGKGGEESKREQGEERGKDGEDEFTAVVGFNPDNVDEETLRSDFGICGEVVRLSLTKGDDSKPKGVALVQFADQDGLGAALKYDGRYCYGGPISVQTASSSGPRRERNDEDGEVIAAMKMLPEEVPSGDTNHWNDWASNDWKSGAWKSWREEEGKANGKPERDKYTVFVKGIAYDVEDEKLQRDFGQCGEIVDLNVIRDWDDKPKGMAFITFKSEEGVEAALRYNGRFCYGRTLLVVKKEDGEDDTAMVGNLNPDNVDEADVAEFTAMVGNLNIDNVDEEKLKSDFGQCGEVIRFSLPKGDDGKPKGMAFVQFANQEGLDATLQYDGKYCYGTMISVQKAWKIAQSNVRLERNDEDDEEWQPGEEGQPEDAEVHRDKLGQDVGQLGEDAKAGFGGQRLHALQIGLGTFGTFVQNLAGTKDEWDPMIGWLLKGVSEARPSHFRGVAVEPVAEHVQRLRRTAARLPQMRVVQAAIGDEDACNIHVHVLTDEAHEALLCKVRPDQRKLLEGDLVYLRNMSSIGEEHPQFASCWRKAMNNFGVDIQMQELTTEVWSYGRMARELDFCGCEVFLVDAEGCDAKILRSMIDHCCEQEAQGKTAWPDVVVFESAGHCDLKEGSNTEWDVRTSLEGHGYMTILESTMNTHLLRSDALERSAHLRKWLEGLYCEQCRKTGSWPLILAWNVMYCKSCYHSKWPSCQIFWI